MAWRSSAKAVERQGVAEEAGPHDHRFGGPGEDRADGDGAEERADAEGGVEDAVVGRLGVDAQVVRRHHRHLADEGQGEQREDEDGDQAAAHDAVGPGGGHAGPQVAPVAGRPAGPGEGGQRDDHQGGDDEEVGHRVPGEDPGRPDEVVRHAADDGADDPRGVHLGRVQRDGARHVLPAHQPREDGRVGRGVQGVAHAHHDHHQHQEDVRGGVRRARPGPGPVRTRVARWRAR